MQGISSNPQEAHQDLVRRIMADAAYCVQEGVFAPSARAHLRELNTILRSTREHGLCPFEVISSKKMEEILMLVRDLREKIAKERKENEHRAKQEVRTRSGIDKLRIRWARWILEEIFVKPHAETILLRLERHAVPERKMLREETAERIAQIIMRRPRK